MIHPDAVRNIRGLLFALLISLPIDAALIALIWSLA